MHCFVCIDLKMHVVAVKLFSLRACCGNDAMDGEHQFCRCSVQKCMSDQTTKECNHVLILCRIRSCNNVRNISSSRNITRALVQTDDSFIKIRYSYSVTI